MSREEFREFAGVGCPLQGLLRAMAGKRKSEVQKLICAGHLERMAEAVEAVCGGVSS